MIFSILGDDDVAGPESTTIPDWVGLAMQLQESGLPIASAHASLVLQLTPKGDRFVQPELAEFGREPMLPQIVGAGVDQAAHYISGAREVGVCEHLEEVHSMSFTQLSVLLVPCAMLEFFPVPFVLRINDERRPLHLARNTAHHRLDPSFKEMLHWHRPGYAFKIAQPGESSLFNSPVNRLEALDETVGTHRAS